MLSNFLSNCNYFCDIVSFFLTNLITLGILFSTTLRAGFIARLVMSGILSSTLFILALYTYFLTTSFFTPSLSLLKSTGAGTYLSNSVFRLAKFFVNAKLKVPTCEIFLISDFVA